MLAFIIQRVAQSIFVVVSVSLLVSSLCSGKLDMLHLRR